MNPGAIKQVDKHTVVLSYPHAYILTAPDVVSPGLLAFFR